MFMEGHLVKTRDGEWLVEYIENVFPYYRFLFPVDLSQEVIESNFLPYNNKVLFSTRYHYYEMYAVVYDPS